LTTKRMDDLFARLRPPADGDQRPQEEAPSPPKEEERVNALQEAEVFLQMTVDQWMDAEGMHTIELSSPRGKLWLTKSRKAHKRLVAAGEVVFTPLEIERFINLKHKDPEAISERLVDQLYQLKKIDPGCKLDEMKLWDEPDASRQS
jgi:hypothetical protein